MANYKQMDVCKSKLEFYLCLAQTLWMFWTIFSDVKTSVWALTESLITEVIPLSIDKFLYLNSAPPLWTGLSANNKIYVMNKVHNMYFPDFKKVVCFL